MASGEIARFNPDKRYGFIRCDGGGDDVLVHVSALCPGEDPSWLRPGARVVFDVRRSDRGLRAVNVRADLRAAGAASLPEFRAEIQAILEDAQERLAEAARRYGWAG